MSVTEPAQTVGIDIKTGEVLWTLTDVYCYYVDQSRDGEAVCAARGTHLVQIDIATGTETVLYSDPAVNIPDTFGLLAVVDGKHIITYSTQGGTTVATLAGNSQVAWLEIIPATVDCFENSGRILCSSMRGYAAFDAATGASIVPFSTYQGKENNVTWGTDGFIVGPDNYIEDDEVGRMFDYEGNKIADVKDDPREPAFPSNYQGATYPLDALQTKGNPTIVDGEGRVVLEQVSNAWDNTTTWQPSGNALENWRLLPQSTTKDGSVVALSTTGGQYTFYDRDGNELYGLMANDRLSQLDGILYGGAGAVEGKTTLYVPQF